MPILLKEAVPRSYAVLRTSWIKLIARQFPYWPDAINSNTTVSGALRGCGLPASSPFPANIILPSWNLQLSLSSPPKPRGPATPTLDGTPTPGGPTTSNPNGTPISPSTPNGPVAPEPNGTSTPGDLS